MEVFLHNLPRDISEVALNDLLAPFMKTLVIHDWLCTKPKKKHFGFIVFLSSVDGQKFLASHGEITSLGYRQSISRLNLLGSNVFCKKSQREPAEHDLRHLAWQAQERFNPTQIIEDEGKAISFNLLRSSCGYTTFKQHDFVYIPEVHLQNYGTLTFKRRNIIVELNNTHRIRIPLNTVFEVVWDRSGSLLVTLMSVPYFTQSQINEQLQETRARLSSLGGSHSELVGQCLVYQFQVDPSQIQSKMNQLEESDLTIVRYDYQTLHAIESWKSQLSKLKELLADYTRDRTLPFGILFQMQALVYNGYLPPYVVLALTRELATMDKKRKMAGKRPISVNAVKRLFDLINWPSPFGEPNEFTVKGLLEMITGSDHDLYQGVTAADSLFRTTPYLAYVHRVMVTPSRITLHGPEVEPLNRILRRFPNHHEYFVRIQFCDENGQDVQFNPIIDNQEVFARFKSLLESGIQIAGRSFTFLGFSHSSLRTHSVWFAAPFVDDSNNFQTYFTIIKAIGTFTNITSPARCAARIGQAFSDTPFALNLKDNEISVWKIPDVQVGQRVYSDGVGTISQDAMDIIHSILPLRKGLPTCFQIRMGGAKGMLSLDPSLKGSQIRVRPSMIKFDVESIRDLEICDSGSKPIPLVLNRQVIKIMEDMGVSDSWFFKLQELRVEQLRKATATTKNTANFIKSQGVGDCIRIYRLLILFHQLKLNYKEIPFLRAVVEATVLRELRLLKHKARIPVDKGITLFGIMDETGFLEENQVFVTYDTMDDRFAPPPGKCRLLVTRSPALHDGDIQYAHHVLPPPGHPLLQHKNCIVFSQKGARDLPSQLSGGDLDGDLYNIIWDPEAAPLRVFAPADYPRVAPIDIQRPVTRTDMAEFFVEFMKSDKLGVIAIKHMILADQMELGTSHSDCKKLAQMHSTAVDFSKTGVPVDLQAMPNINRNRPDFLAPGPLSQIHQKEDIQLEERYIHPYPDEDAGPIHKYYRSDKILGRLYRAIDEHKIWSQEIRSTITANPEAVWKRLVDSLTARCITLGASVNWQGHIETARQLRAAYEDAITTAMRNFSDHPIHPITELEVFIGQILNNSGVQTHRQRERSIKLKDQFERIASWVLGQMRPAGPVTGYATEYDALERCLACFHIAERGKSKSRRRRGWDDLESFRVVAACALLMEVERLEKMGRDLAVVLDDENVRPAFVPGSSTVAQVETGGRDVRSAGYGYWNVGSEKGDKFNVNALLTSLGVKLG